MGKAQEIYAQILELEKEWGSFSEETATDADRYRIYPKKLALSNLYCDLAKLIERRQPKESLYCYWRSFCLTSHSIAANRVFLGEFQPPSETDSVEELSHPVQSLSPEESKFLEALQNILGVGVVQNPQRGLSILKDELQHDAHALFYLGVTYATGNAEVPVDKKQAVHYYTLAAQLGQGLAQNNLAEIYEAGFGFIPVNTGKTLLYFELPETQGADLAQSNLTGKNEDGYGGSRKNIEQAVFYYQSSAKQGESPAQLNLARQYEAGAMGLKRNIVNATYYYYLAALQGNTKARNILIRMADYNKDNNPLAQFWVGEMYEFGANQVPKNIDKAASYYFDSSVHWDCGALKHLIRADPIKCLISIADTGNNLAQFWVGKIYDGSYYRTPHDIQKAAHYYHLAALQGNTQAQKNLISIAEGGMVLAQFWVGEMYELGLGGFQKNIQEALAYYQAAALEGHKKAQEILIRTANEGHACAQLYVGDMYEFGVDGLPTNMEQAIFYYHLAALQGNTEAQEILIKIANEGNAFAQYWMGEIYELGARKLAQNIRKAVSYYHLAAQQNHAEAEKRLVKIANEGNALAQYCLGLLYESGTERLEKNLDEAFRYYYLAAKQRNAAARKNLIAIANQVNASYQFYIGKAFELGTMGFNKDPNRAFYYYQLAIGYKNPVLLGQSFKFYQYLKDSQNKEQAIQLLEQMKDSIEHHEKAFSMIDLNQFLWTEDEKEIRPEFEETLDPRLLYEVHPPIPYVVTHVDAMMAHPTMKAKRSAGIDQFVSFDLKISIRDRLTRETLIELLKNARNPETIRELEADSNLMALLNDSDRVVVMLANELYETVPTNIDSRFLPAIREAAFQGSKGGKALLCEIYKRGNIPVRLADFLLFLQDKQAFEEAANNPVTTYFESIKPLMFDKKNLEAIYCILRLTKKEVFFIEFQEHINPTQLLEFVTRDATVLPEAKCRCFLILLPDILAQQKPTVTPTVVDAMIDLFEIEPKFLIQYLHGEGKAGKQLFFKRVQERHLTERFRNTEEGLIWEALSSSCTTPEKRYTYLLNGMFAVRNPSTPNSTLQFLTSLSMRQKDNLPTMFQYEAMTLEFLKVRESTLQKDNQEAFLENTQRILLFFSKNNAGLFLQIELFFMYQRMDANETVLLECLETLNRLFTSLEIKLSEIPNSEWKDKFILNVKEKLEALSNTETKYEGCHHFIESHCQEWIQSLDTLPQDFKKPNARRWGSAAAFFGGYSTPIGYSPIEVKDSSQGTTGIPHLTFA